MLIDSVVTCLRSQGATLLSDDGSQANCRVFADYAAPLGGVPWAVVRGVTEQYERMTIGPNGRQKIAHGQLYIDIYHSDREKARELADVAILVLENAGLSPTDGRLMDFWCSGVTDIGQQQTGPETPAIFLRTLTFDYQQQRSP